MIFNMLSSNFVMGSVLTLSPQTRLRSRQITCEFNMEIGRGKRDSTLPFQSKHEIMSIKESGYKKKQRKKKEYNMEKHDTELFIQSYLGPGDTVCTIYDFVTNQSNKQNTKKTFKPVFRGQIGIVRFEIVSVNKESLKKLENRNPDNDRNKELLVVKNVDQDSPEEIYYCVDFIDFKTEINYPEHVVFETLIIQRKHLLPLRKELVYPPKEQDEKKWQDEKMWQNINSTEFHVETELQILAKKDKRYKEFLDIYNYKPLLHDNWSGCSKIGEIVTVQEVLYEHNDIGLNDPIVWPGQIGIISRIDKKEDRVEVIFLNQNIREFLYLSTHSEKIPEHLKNIFTDPDHRQIKITIEKKFLFPLYAQELQFSNDEKQKHLRNKLERDGVLKQKTIVENSPSRVTTPIVIPGLKTDKDFPWWPINLVPDNDKKKEKKKILELQIVGPFVLNNPVLLCRNDTNVEQGEVGRIIKIINFDRVLVDFTTPLVSKNFTKVQLKKLTFQTRSESVVLLNF